MEEGRRVCVSRLPCCAAAPAGDGFQRKLLGTALGPGVVFNLVCRLLRSLSFLPSFLNFFAAIAFIFPPATCHNSCQRRTRGPRLFRVEFRRRNWTSAGGAFRRMGSGEWGPQTVNWAATLPVEERPELKWLRIKHSRIVTANFVCHEPGANSA